VNRWEFEHAVFWALIAANESFENRVTLGTREPTFNPLMASARRKASRRRCILEALILLVGFASTPRSLMNGLRFHATFDRYFMPADQINRKVERESDLLAQDKTRGSA